MEQASARAPPTAARMASTSEPVQPMSASPSASSVTRRYDVRMSAARTVVFVASIPSSLAMRTLSPRVLVPDALLDAPVDDRAGRVGVHRRQDAVGGERLP